MRAPVRSASVTIARSFRGHAARIDRCSSSVRMRVRRLSTFSRLRAGESSSLPHSTALLRIARRQSSSRLTVAGQIALPAFSTLWPRHLPASRSRLNCSIR